MPIGISGPSLSPPLLRLTSRKPLWLDLQPVDIKSRWRHNCQSAQVVNSHLVCDPTIQQPGFNLPRQQWSLLNRFRTEQGHCSACRRKWRLTDRCPCGKTQMMSHIVESCPLPWQLISCLTSYGSWHAYEKKKKRSMKKKSMKHSTFVVRRSKFKVTWDRRLLLRSYRDPFGGVVFLVCIFAHLL